MMSHQMSIPCETLPCSPDFHDTLLTPASFHSHFTTLPRSNIFTLNFINRRCCIYLLRASRLTPKNAILHELGELSMTLLYTSGRIPWGTNKASLGNIHMNSNIIMIFIIPISESEIQTNILKWNFCVLSSAAHWPTVPKFATRMIWSAGKSRITNQCSFWTTLTTGFSWIRLMVLKSFYLYRFLSITD